VLLLREPSAFHRLGAGIAKVKIKEKAHESHGLYSSEAGLNQ
jgi:hypothetical protein